MSEIENQAHKLAKFAQEQNFDERYLQYFDEIWREAGVQDLSKATTQDAEKALQVLADGAASGEFIKAWLSQAANQGVPPNVLEYLLDSDLDGDGRTLAQEIFVDGSNPLESDSSKPLPTKQYANVKSHDLEPEL